MDDPAGALADESWREAGGVQYIGRPLLCVFLVCTHEGGEKTLSDDLAGALVTDHTTTLLGRGEIRG